MRAKTSKRAGMPKTASTVNQTAAGNSSLPHRRFAPTGYWLADEESQFLIGLFAHDGDTSPEIVFRTDDARAAQAFVKRWKNEPGLPTAKILVRQKSYALGLPEDFAAVEAAERKREADYKRLLRETIAEASAELEAMEQGAA